jgi:hypothetical protein
LKLLVSKYLRNGAIARSAKPKNPIRVMAAKGNISTSPGVIDNHSKPGNMKPTKVNIAPQPNSRFEIRWLGLKSLSISIRFNGF